MGSLANLISGLTTIFQDLTGKTAATKASEVATEIWDEITTGSKLSDADGDTYLELEESADDDHARIYTAGTERLTIDNSGNIGIGTTSPIRKLHLHENSSGLNFMKFTNSTTTSAILHGLILGIDANEDALMWNYENTNLFFGTNNTKRLTIDSSGNVGIGTASPGYQLELSTDSAGKPSTNTWTIVSDERVKKNIESFNDGLEVLLSLEPIQYEYNGKGGYNTEGIQIGFNATAEIEKNKANYLFGTYKAKLNEGDEEETELLNYNGHALPFILLNSIKELNKKIETLEERIEELEKK